MKEQLQKAFETLQQGGTILYPTDTIWGVGCDARHAEAVKKILALKHRDARKSFIVLLDEPGKLDYYVKEVPPIAWDLIEYAENPLTIVYPDGRNLAPGVINTDGSVAIRIIKNGFAKELVRKFRYPIVSTSANSSGNSSPSRFSEIEEGVLHGVDYVVNLPDEGTGKPSSIIRLEVSGKFSFLRR